MFLLLLQRREKGTSDCKLQEIITGPNLHKLGNTYLDLPDKHLVEWSIPPCRKLHGWRVSLLVLNETDPDNVLLFVLEEETNSLEATRVTSPAARARHTSGKTLCFVPVRHATRKLQFRMIWSIPIGPSGRVFITRSWIACRINVGQIQLS